MAETIEPQIIRTDRLPYLRVRSVKIKDLKSFENVEFDFFDNQFVCFIGPNGTGKSTALQVIQLIFSKNEGSDMERLNARLGRVIRQVKGRGSGTISCDDFLITAQIECEYGDYEVKINKDGFIKDHPPYAKELLFRLCYFSSLDRELHQFQLKKEKWDIFKDLFEKITGYEIAQQDDLNSSASFDPMFNEEMEKYVLGFWVTKPHEVVFYRDCSDGERKVIKSLSTLLNMDFTPRIILIDNIEMHVESKRHMPLVISLKKCFPESQIFSTTHSTRISKNFQIQREIYDLRWIYASPLFRKEPWRLYCIDEIDDFVSKAECLYDKVLSDKLVKDGIYIRKNLLESVDGTGLIDSVKKFTRDVEENFVNDMLGLKSEHKIVNLTNYSVNSKES